MYIKCCGAAVEQRVYLEEGNVGRGKGQMRRFGDGAHMVVAVQGCAKGVAVDRAILVRRREGLWFSGAASTQHTGRVYCNVVGPRHGVKYLIWPVYSY